jgi:hypothetical protein
MLNEAHIHLLGTIPIAKNPEYRNIDAFDFVYSQLNHIVRAQGIRNAQLDRKVLVGLAIAQNIPERDVEAAVTIMVMCSYLKEDDNQLRPPGSGWNHQQLPSQQLGRMNVPHSAGRERAYSLVRDMIQRRTDGRPPHAEPFDAFAEALHRLGYGQFRLWWTQIVTELQHSNPGSSPTSVLVLAAALVEGTLAFVVKYARHLNLGVFQSTDFDRDPRTWKIDDLVNSAARGGDTTILDDRTRARALNLIATRQRIHAGRMLSDFPRGVPDLRPEEPRDAIATAEQVVRCVLDWLDKYPPSDASSA